MRKKYRTMIGRKTLKRILMSLLSGALFLTACGQTSPGAQTPLTSVVNEATAIPSPIPKNTSTSISTEAPTATITPLPTIPTFTPTFEEFVQPNPFPTETPNATAQAIAQKWNVNSASLSPNGLWAAVSDH